MNIKAKINRIFSDKASMRAISEVVIDDAVVIHGVRLMERDGRQYLAMPFRTWKDKTGEELSRDVAHPITSEARQQMLRAVLEAYDSAMKEGLQDEGREENA